MISPGLERSDNPGIIISERLRRKTPFLFGVTFKLNHTQKRRKDCRQQMIVVLSLCALPQTFQGLIGCRH